jgi:hypothetical protein
LGEDFAPPRKFFYSGEGGKTSKFLGDFSHLEIMVMRKTLITEKK